MSYNNLSLFRCSDYGNALVTCSKTGSHGVYWSQNGVWWIHKRNVLVLLFSISAVMGVGGKTRPLGKVFGIDYQVSFSLIFVFHISITAVFGFDCCVSHYSTQWWNNEQPFHPRIGCHAVVSIYMFIFTINCSIPVMDVSSIFPIVGSHSVGIMNPFYQSKNVIRSIRLNTVPSTNL